MWFERNNSGNIIELMSEVNSRATVPGVHQESHEVLPEALPVVALRELDLDDVEV